MEEIVAKEEFQKDQEEEQEEEDLEKDSGAVEETPIGNEEQPEKISQNEMRRRKRKQFRDQQFQEMKLKKKEEKQKQKQQEALRKLNEQPKPEEVQRETTQKQGHVKYNKKHELLQQYIEKRSKGVKVIIDLDFEQKMSEKEIQSMCKQLSYCHSANKKSDQPLNFILTDYKGQIKEKTLQNGADHWGIDMHEQCYTKYYQADQLVYLTGDAEEEFGEDFDENQVYIIGGIVDRNRYPKITYNKAVSDNIKTLKFPIGKYVDLKTSCILTVNHVFDILLKKASGMSWKECIITTIPIRKLKGNNNASSSDDDEKDANNHDNQHTQDFKQDIEQKVKSSEQ